MRKSKVFTIITMLAAVISLAACTANKGGSDTPSPTTAPGQTSSEDTAGPEDTGASEGTSDAGNTAATAEQLDFKGSLTTVVGDAEIVFRLNNDKTYLATSSMGSYGMKTFSEGTWEYTDNSFSFTEKEGGQFKSKPDADGQQTISGVWTVGSLTDQEITAVAEKDAVAAFVPAE